jgi:hypothetical protein
MRSLVSYYRAHSISVHKRTRCKPPCSQKHRPALTIHGICVMKRQGPRHMNLTQRAQADRIRVHHGVLHSTRHAF